MWSNSIVFNERSITKRHRTIVAVLTPMLGGNMSLNFDGDTNTDVKFEQALTLKPAAVQENFYCKVCLLSWEQIHCLT